MMGKSITILAAAAHAQIRCEKRVMSERLQLQNTRTVHHDSALMGIRMCSVGAAARGEPSTARTARVGTRGQQNQRDKRTASDVRQRESHVRPYLSGRCVSARSPSSLWRPKNNTENPNIRQRQWHEPVQRQPSRAPQRTLARATARTRCTSYGYAFHHPAAHATHSSVAHSATGPCARAATRINALSN